MSTDSPAPLAGWQVLDEAATYLARFIAFPSDAARDAVALWCAHTHVTEACNASGRLAVLSDQPGSGKTLTLELCVQLCRGATLEADLTGPALVGLVSQGARTVCMDEVDQYWGRNGGESYRQLRTVVNSGYRQGASITRRTGQGVRHDPVYGAIALAGLGSLPGSVLSRCIVIAMSQRPPEKRTERYVARMHAPLGAALGDALGGWARSVALDIAASWPDMPEPDRITDRQAEVWEPLIAIADLAGRDWPARARAAAIELVLGNAATPVLSPGQRILTDLRTIWIGDGTSLPTATIVQRLFALPDAPWAMLWSDANAPRELSGLLAAYNVRPVKIRDGERTCQGYRRSDLARVWPVQPAITAAPDDNMSSLATPTPEHASSETPDVPAPDDVPEVPAQKRTTPARRKRTPATAGKGA